MKAGEKESGTEHSQEVPSRRHDAGGASTPGSHVILGGPALKSVVDGVILETSLFDALGVAPPLGPASVPAKAAGKSFCIVELVSSEEVLKLVAAVEAGKGRGAGLAFAAATEVKEKCVSGEAGGQRVADKEWAVRGLLGCGHDHHDHGRPHPDKLIDASGGARVHRGRRAEGTVDHDDRVPGDLLEALASALDRSNLQERAVRCSTCDFPDMAHTWRAYPSSFPPAFQRVSVTVGATFAMDGLETPLHTALHAVVGVSPVVVRHWIPYGAHLQFLESTTASAPLDDEKNRNVVIVFVRVEDLSAEHPELLVGASRDTWESLLTGICVTRLDAFCKAVEKCVSSGRFERVLVILCPFSTRVGVDLQLSEALQALEAVLVHRVNSVGAVAQKSRDLFPADEGTHVDVDGPPGIRDASHVPYDPVGHAAVALGAARALHRACFLPTVKVLCVDCDGTLWDGAVGDLGPEGVSFTAGHLAVQSACVAAHARGVLVALVSRNSHEKVVKSVFDTRGSEMILSWDTHVVAAKVALFSRKSDMIVELSKELNLGLDSFAFLDDSPVECAEVCAALSAEGVQTLILPRDPEKYAATLAGWWPLDVPPAFSNGAAASAEDKGRTDMYRAEALRKQERQRSASGTAFLASLSLRIDVDALDINDKDTVARVAQLTDRTNQFVTNKVPLTPSQVVALVSTPGKDVLISRVTDRFGHYGLVCVAVSSGTCTVPGETIEALEVPLFLMSCRVLHRGVEHAMVRRMASLALSRDLHQLAFRYMPSDRNALADRFLRVLPGVRFKSVAGETMDELPQRLATPLWAIVGAKDAASFDIEADAVMPQEGGKEIAAAGASAGAASAGSGPSSKECKDENDGPTEISRPAFVVGPTRAWLHWETYGALAEAWARGGDRGLAGFVADLEVDPFRAILGEDADEDKLADSQGRARLRRKARHAVKELVTQANQGKAGYVTPSPPPGSGDNYI